MNINEFPNPKLNLPKDIKDKKLGDTSFKAIDTYINTVKQYIYTEIDLGNDPEGPIHIHAWILRLVSASMIRSLYIRNSLVDAFNSRNIVGFFLPLKAWFEVVGFLASILSILESNMTSQEIFDKLQPYALGNKGKGNLRVGIIEGKSVADMIQKADKYIKKISKETGKDDSTNYFTDFYDVASNPSHPSFDAHELVGKIKKEGIWHASYPEEFKQELTEWLPGYGGLLMAPIFIKNICEKIFSIEKDHFSQVKCIKYFD